MKRLDPESLAARQLARDRAATRTPALFARKTARMTASAFGFLRGSAPLFYDVLARIPALAEGPRGEGWLAGDLHLENFGAYRAGAPRAAGHADVAFDVNDFDDGVVGPHRLDVVRLATSTLLMARGAGASGARALEVTSALLDGYAHAMERRAPPPPPAPIERLLTQVRARTRRALLAARTIGHGDLRRFARGAHYLDIGPALDARARAVFARWAAPIAADHGIDPAALTVLDVAFRVAGTGSLGALRLAILVRGKGGKDGAWVFELKEEGVPSPSSFLTPPRLVPAARVVTAMNACQAHPPKLLGAVVLDGRSMLARRLTPQEDKLALAAIGADEIDGTAAYLGAIAAQAHRRGATKPARRAWKRRELDALLSAAIELAGIHEAAYVAYCGLVAKEPPLATSPKAARARRRG